jgi:hypothetical protein
MPLAIAPVPAYAQEIPVWLAAAAASPVLVIVLAVVLGFVARSWRIGTLHAGLVLLWVVLIVIALRTLENDYLIWTPVALYAIHAALILILILVGTLRRVRADPP